MRETKRLKSIPSEYVLKMVRRFNPDTMYRRGSITWIFDPNTNKLYHEEYPDMHAMMLNGYYKNTGHSVAELIGLDHPQPQREDAIAAGHILGRIGVIKQDGQTFKAIGIWNDYFEGDELERCLESIVKQFPDLARDKDRVIVISDKGEGFEPFILGDLNINLEVPQNMPQDQTRQAIPPQCSKLAYIDMAGERIPLEDVVGKLHNVKGVERHRMEGIFCSAVPELRERLKKAGCQYHLGILNTIAKRIGCKEEGVELYHQLKDQGRKVYKRELWDMFNRAGNAARSGSGEDPLGHFRTQGELDAAWDSLFSKREHRFYSFKEWLKERK